MARNSPRFRCCRSLVFSAIIFVGLSSSAQDRRSWKSPKSSPTGSKAFKSKSGNDKSRWTLKDWLEQKDRNKMMDLWLGMYAPSPYELIFSGAQIDYKADSDNPVSTVNYKSWVGSVYFYALVLGIGVQYENNWIEHFTDAQGTVNVRVAGNSNASTHLNLFGGLRNRLNETLEIRGQPLAGAELEIYVGHHWGLHGNYRYFFNKDIENVGTLFGDRLEGGIFIEFEPLRIFGNWYSETLNTTPLAGTATNTSRSGLLYGLRILF